MFFPADRLSRLVFEVLSPAQSHPVNAPISYSVRCTELTYIYDTIQSPTRAAFILTLLCSVDSSNSLRFFLVLHQGDLGEVAAFDEDAGNVCEARCLQCFKYPRRPLTRAGGQSAKDEDQ